jgi:hypothetical protein
MVLKIISIALALCAAELFLINLQAPSDPLYMIISNNPYFVSIRMLLILAAVGVAFKSHFKYRLTRNSVTVLGSLLLILGTLGAVSQSVTVMFSSFMMYLDFWLIFLIGTVFSIAALSYPSKNAKMNLPIFMLRLLSKIPVDKLSHAASLQIRPVNKSKA